MVPAGLVAIILGITYTEWVFAYRDVGQGIVIALGLTIVLYIIASVTGMNQRFSHCVESVALIPLYILFTSSLPWFFIPQQLLLPGVYSLILALGLWHMRQRDLSLAEVGLRRDNLTRYIVLGLLLAIPTGFAEYFILTPAPTFPTFEFKYLARDLVYMIGFVGLGEELLFRGLIQRDLTTLFGWKWGLVGASFLFMVMHLTWRSSLELLFTFIGALVLGYIYYRTRSLVAPIVMHGVGNTVLVAIMPYLFGL